MALETKLVYSNFWKMSKQKLVNLYSSFGWQTISATAEFIVMNRDTKINNYIELRKMEEDFKIHEKKAIELFHKTQVNGLVFLILLLFFIFPGIIYAASKASTKDEYLRELKKMEEISLEAYSLFYSTN